MLFASHLVGEPATGQIVRFLWRMAVLQRLGMECPLRVVAPYPVPQKPRTPLRPAAGFRIIAALRVIVCI